MLDKIRDWIKPRIDSDSPDGFRIRADDPYANGHLWLNQYFNELYERRVELHRDFWKVRPRKLQSVATLLKENDEMRIAVACAIPLRMEWIARNTKSPVRIYSHDADSDWTSGKDGILLGALGALMSEIMRSNIDFHQDQLIELLGGTIEIISITGGEPYPYSFVPYGLPIASILLRAVENYGSDHSLSLNLRQTLETLKASSALTDISAESRKLKYRIDQLLGGGTKQTFDAGDIWAESAQQDLSQMDASSTSSWNALIEHAADSGASKPSNKWIKRATELINAIGEDDFRQRLMRWFPLVREAGVVERRMIATARREVAPPADMMLNTLLPLSDRNCDILKGLIWCCSLVSPAELASTVCELSESCFRKIPNYGARSVKAGNACLYTLGAMPGQEGVAQLARLKLKVKYPSAQKLIEKALAGAAQRAGLAPEELEELSVPTYGLDEDGCLREAFGETTAQLCIVGTDKTELRWVMSDGRTQRSPPASVQRDHAVELKAIKQSIKEIEKMLPAQRDRLELLFLEDRSWDFVTWRDRYLNHPLIGSLARRLIWQFEDGVRTTLGICREDQLWDEEDHPLDWLTPQTVVRLWHPIDSVPESVMAWREALERHNLTQPFKQSYREVYIITDAERETEIYSNRFAAHVLRQHQFAALCRQRGWSYHLIGAFDSHNVPTRELRRWNLRTEFWVDWLGDDAEISGASIYLYIGTDQVRFCTLAGEPVRLEQVPALVLSEVMRDVDLFVSVCSVGNDPNWLDRGDRVGDYWDSYSFGELSTIGHVRKEVLERLLPKLKIAQRCHIDGRFLVVKGDLRTYKIHLNSGNVLMEPNSQYLCIVAGRGGTLKEDTRSVFLPFEGDWLLSVILSKAFLLADDKNIKDPTIINQIRR